jgi:ketosteroid isomerase-like protein
VIAGRLPRPGSRRAAGIFAVAVRMAYPRAETFGSPAAGGEEPVHVPTMTRQASLPRAALGLLSLAISAEAVLLLSPSSPPAVARAAEPSPRATDETSIRAAAKAYREALSKGDAAAIAALWTADADIVDGQGSVLPASAAAALGGEPGAGPRPQVALGDTRLRFVAADVAIEDGSVSVTPPGAVHPIEGWFTAIWVRQGDAWKIAGLRESERPVLDGPESIDDLGWMVGEWEVAAGAADGGAPPMRMSVSWDATRAFLVRDLRVPAPGDDAPAEVVIHQRIGWDPVQKRIRSWTFSPDGGIAEATWTRDGGSWVARGLATLSDGTQVASITISTLDGEDRFTWRTLPGSMDEDDAPDAVTWVRKASDGGTK